MAATVHFFGVTFYGIFASGELQPWSEPTPEQLKAWEEAANLQKPQPPRPPVPVNIHTPKLIQKFNIILFNFFHNFQGPLPPGTTETQLTYTTPQTYGTLDPSLQPATQPSNPFKPAGNGIQNPFNQPTWGDEPNYVTPSQLELSQQPSQYQPVSSNRFITPGSNPFSYSNTITEETVQPEPQDPYLHGSLSDRAY